MGLSIEKPCLDRSGIRSPTAAFAQPLWTSNSAIYNTHCYEGCCGLSSRIRRPHKKVVLAGSDLMAVVNARSTHCILVECFDGDVPYSEGLLRVAHGGTPVIMFGKATVIQD